MLFVWSSIYDNMAAHMTIEMNNLDIIKASQQSDIPAMFLK